MKAVKASRGAHHLWVGFNSRWGSIVSIFVFDWGSINIFMGWGCNQEWGSNRADTVVIFEVLLYSAMLQKRGDFKQILMKI